jgi:hypothetical protein
MKNTPIQVAGMAWYLAEDFSEIKALMEDGHKLHSSHAGWQAAAEQGEKSLSAKGVRVYRAIVRPAAFKAWCDARGLKLNAEARNQFAAGFAADEYSAGR